MNLSKNLPLGVMQGRLSPLSQKGLQCFPTEGWEKEFYLAKQIGLEHIEWLIDYSSFYENPIWQSIKEINSLVSTSGIQIRSLCLDAAMHISFSNLLEWLEGKIINEILIQASLLRIEVICLPLLELTSIQDNERKMSLSRALIGPIKIANNLGLKLALETDLNADQLINFLQLVNEPCVGITLDVGNLYSQKQNSLSQFKQLFDCVYLIHLKDRSMENKPVKIGEGKSQVLEFWKMLCASEYTGPVTLEAYRGENFFEDITLQLARLQQS